MHNVLVIGAPRSGTTLVAGMLSADERVCPMLPECSYMTQVIEHYYNFLHFSDPQRFAVYAKSEARLTKMYQGLIASMLQTVSENFKDANFQFLVLKDPELTIYVDLIPTFFGETTKIVQVIRDPRAVIASMISVERKKRKKVLQALANELSLPGIAQYIKSLYHSWGMANKYFKYYSVVHESRLRREGRVISVSYEKIISKDDAEIERLESCLGFKVSREGFGKIYIDFDRSDPTFSLGYGREIQSEKKLRVPKLTWFQRRRIMRIFSSLNREYSWW